jgi:hypothetical protein
VEAAGSDGAWSCERGVLLEHPPGPAELADPSRAGQRVDRPALPGQAADDGRRPERRGQLGDHERADDITAAADADGEDPLRRGDRREQSERPA